jgi:hypothetical protein
MPSSCRTTARSQRATRRHRTPSRNPRSSCRHSGPDARRAVVAAREPLRKCNGRALR